MRLSTARSTPRHEGWLPRVAVWTDAQNATVCGPVQSYRAASLAAGTLALAAPWPLVLCPETFGNTDIWSATTG